MDVASYTETTGSLSIEAKIAQSTIIQYCREGLLDFKTLPNGMRLLRVGQAQRVREIYRARRANRGRRRIAADA